MKYCSAIKNNKILINTTSWINVKNIKLGKRSLTQKNILVDSTYMKLNNRKTNLWWQEFIITVVFWGVLTEKAQSNHLASVSWSITFYSLIQGVVTQVSAYVKSLKSVPVIICILYFNKTPERKSLDNINMMDMSEEKNKASKRMLYCYWEGNAGSRAQAQ